MERVTRVLIAKPGLDGHDRGAKLISRLLAEAGVEVIYTGKFQTPEQIVAAGIQEDVDGIGMSILSGSHLTLFKSVLDLLKEKKADDILVFGGGVIMPDEIPVLEKMGVDKVFPPDSQTSQIVEYVKKIPSRNKRS